MASGSNNNRGRARQLNLNETYSGRVSSQPSFQSSQQTPGFEHEISSLNMDNESDSQSDDDVGNDGIREPAHVIPNQQRYRRVFKASWKFGRPWLLDYRPNDGPATNIMKCVVCQEMHVESRWGTCIGCKSLQKSTVKVHEKSVDHKYSVARWEDIHFPQRANAPPVLQRLNVIVDREQSIIITVMKVLYFTVWNDRSILTYQDTCQLLSLLQTPNMPVNDEYGSYTSGYATLEFLWTIFKYLNDKLLSEAQSSPYFSLMIDEATDRTLEQH
jgi:hypothetical protein